MVELAVGLSIASMVYTLYCFWRLRKCICPCAICQHFEGLSEEALQDIIKGALPETHLDETEKITK